jgi:hypothetical protein
MSALAQVPIVAARAPQDDLLVGDVIAHLELQLVSVRRLLGVVLEQGRAIRRRDVAAVVREAGLLAVEMHRGRAIEEARSRLLERAGARLRMASSAVTLEALTSLMDPISAQIARDRSAEMRGMLNELQREHAVNRALMSQELAFLDHLLRLVDGEGSGAYGSAAARPSANLFASVAPRRVLDMRA